ncbi:MAG: hypothetical protein ACPGU4_01115 [Flavobacteriales bacterium]
MNRLRDLVSAIDQSLYTHVNTKGRASVGQHVRHTIEFYQRLFKGDDEINYDKRERDILIESSMSHATVVIDSIIRSIEDVSKDYSLVLKAEFPSVSSEPIAVNSSLSRELLYVLEHAIHHMALIRILIKDEEPNFELPESFGVAYSTLAYISGESRG